MNLYENIVIINSSLSDEEIEAATEKIKDLITAEKGEILKVEPWGRRKLAYELNKQTRGFFVLLLFNAPSTVVKKLEDFYKVYDPVFKYMVVRLEKKQIQNNTMPIPPRLDRWGRRGLRLIFTGRSAVW